MIQNPKLDADLTLISPHWNVAIEGNTITGDVVNRITDYITSAAMKKFLIRTSKLCEDTYNWVDWESSGRAIQGMRPAERVWVTKFASGFCGTASMMSRWKSGGWESDRCPLCGTSRETVDHLLWCSASSCKQRRHDATIDFVQWMRDNHTEASIQYCITQILQQGPSTNFRPIQMNVLTLWFAWLDSNRMILV